MNKMKIDTVTDSNGTLRIQIPGRQSKYEVHVFVKWKELPRNEMPGWPPGWIEATAGSIDDPTFVRPPQLPYEKREKME